MIKVAPSVLSADFANLGRDIRMLNGCADILHLDIMDGTFVPNISFGFPVIKSIAGISTLPMDAHLMVVHPERWFETLRDLGVRMVSFHLEASGRSTLKFIGKLHEMGIQAGVAIDPDVDVKKLFPYIGKADFLLIMSVFAGFGGQKFIYESLDRVSMLKSEILKLGADTLIEVDGGVNTSNALSLKEAGADILVAGNAVFSAAEPEKVVRDIRNL